MVSVIPMQMNKKMRKLEKESQTYKSRFENTNLALVKMVEQKEQYEKIIDMQVSYSVIIPVSYVTCVTHDSFTNRAKNVRS